MKLHLLSLTLFAACTALLRAETQPDLKTVIRENLDFAAQQYTGLLARVKDSSKIPRTYEHGKLDLVPSRDWTSGFFPGVLWFLYEDTQDARWRSAAENFTARLEREKKNRTTHDLGFMLFCSYGQGFRLTGNKKYEGVLLQGAESLYSRYNPTVGCIRSWDFGPWKFPVIIDNMMNLEYLIWAAKAGNKPQFREASIRHADTTLLHHYRPDNSCYHVVSYNPKDGSVERKQTHQGISDDSAWARGQGWGLYGYTFMYRETRDPRYLAQAEKIAAFMIDHPRMPADLIPYWDYDDKKIPNAPRDASAGALMASALLELSEYATTPVLAAKYRQVAEKQIRVLGSPAYRAKLGENGNFILKHSVGNMPKNSEVDTPLNYADYYFVEALLRLRALLDGKGPPPPVGK
jgi:unsaturated chondroitin disaccharide hydrolase